MRITIDELIDLIDRYYKSNPLYYDYRFDKNLTYQEAFLIDFANSNRRYHDDVVDDAVFDEYIKWFDWGDPRLEIIASYHQPKKTDTPWSDVLKDRSSSAERMVFPRTKLNDKKSWIHIGDSWRCFEPYLTFFKEEREASIQWWIADEERRKINREKQRARRAKKKAEKEAAKNGK